MKILVVSPTPTHPQNAGNRARIYSLLTCLKSQGHEIHVLLDDRERLSNHVASKADIGAMSETWHGVHVCERPLPQGANDTMHEDLPQNRSLLVADRFRRWLEFLHNLYKRTQKNLFGLHKLVRNNLWRLRAPVYLIKGCAWRLRYGPGRVLKSHFPSVYSRLHPLFRKVVKPNAEIAHKQAEKMEVVLKPVEQEPLPEEVTEPTVDQQPEIDKWYNPSIDSMALHLHNKHKFDAVIVIYVFMSRVLKNFDHSVLKIIDTNDCFTERNEKLENEGISDTFFSTSATEEAAGLNRADRIIAIQEKENLYFQSLTGKEVITIGHLVELAEPETRKETIRSILYVGSGNIANVHGLKSFLDHALPLVRHQIPEVRMIVAGNVCNFIPDQEGLEKLGELEDVRDAYALADIVVNPTVAGTGLKIKNVEALGNGKILITSPHGVEGFGSEDPPILIANSAEEYATGIIDIMLDVDRYNDLAVEAYQYAMRYNQRQFVAIESLLHIGSGNRRALEP